MKHSLLILSIALLTIASGMSQNRYSEDEVVTTGEYPNDTTFLKADMTPLNGIVYAEYIDG